MGAAYREEVTQPVGVPGVVRGESGVAAPVAVAGGVGAVVPAGMPTMPELPKSVDVTGVPSMTGGPVVAGAVTPVPAGVVQPVMPVETNVPTLQLADNGGQQAVYVAGQTKSSADGMTFTKDAAVAPTPVAAVNGQEYVVAPGDTLGKIAVKFYHSSKGEALARIVAANPKVLKDEKTMLVAGKKLLIPTVVAVKAAPAVAVVPVKKVPVVIHQPGASAVAGADVSKAIVGPAKVYVVQSGDTLEKIAKRIAPGHVVEMEKMLEKVNGIKDPTGLKVGQKLKVG
jgi:LysM repeat protein